VTALPTVKKTFEEKVAEGARRGTVYFGRGVAEGKRGSLQELYGVPPEDWDTYRRWARYGTTLGGVPLKDLVQRFGWRGKSPRAYRGLA